jgi:tyrosine-protein kinase Etk/Wzc
MAGENREFTVTNGGATTPNVPPALPPKSPGKRDEDSLANVLREGRWLIVGAFLASALVLLAYLAIATPLYESDVLFQIQERRQGAAAQALADLPTALAGPQSQADTEIEVLQSRRLLGSVVDSLSLDVSVTPVYFPVIGHAWARRHGKATPTAGPWGPPRFVWGREKANVSRLDFSVEPGDSTTSFLLVAGKGGKFEVRDEAGKAIAAGDVGQAVTWDMAAQGGEGTATLFVQELRAHPGAEFSLEKISRVEAIQRLRESLKLAEKGHKTGVIRVSMRGPDPSLVVATLDTLANAYLRHNAERRSDEAERTLQFLDSQIPALRGQVQVAEAALEQYKSRAGGKGVDLTAATKATLERTVEMEKRLSEMELRRTELLYRFTGTHPALLAIDEQVAQLRGQRETLNRQIRELPEAEAVSLRLMRDVKVANELYVTLLNKAQELRVMKGGLEGNALILDVAVRPGKPVTPNVIWSGAVAVAAGLLLGLVLAFWRKATQKGRVDPGGAE